MLEKIKETLAISINDLVLRAMEPSDLIAELIVELERYAITLRTEAAKAISAKNRLKVRVEEGKEELTVDLEKATDLADTYRKLLDTLEKKLNEANMMAEQMAAGISSSIAQNVVMGISLKYKGLDEYLKSLREESV